MRVFPDPAGVCALLLRSAVLVPSVAAPTFAGGAVHDPVAALVFCSPQPVDFAFVNGRLLVESGMHRHIDLPRLVERHYRAAVALMRRAEGG